MDLIRRKRGGERPGNEKNGREELLVHEIQETNSNLSLSLSFIPSFIREEEVGSII